MRNEVCFWRAWQLGDSEYLKDIRGEPAKDKGTMKLSSTYISLKTRSARS